MDISIVIPTLNESHKIARDIQAAAAFLARNRLSGEIIVADDGSTDDTAETAEKAQPGHGVGLRVVRLSPQRGKGRAVATGVAKSSGDYVMFADSGCCVPYENAMVGLEMIKTGICEIAHGSRKLAESKINTPQNAYRRVCSALFRQIIHRAMRIPAELTDTQCGFKIYRGDVARKLYSECVSNGFMFDIEIILRALREGYRIREFPVEWTCDRDSRLRPVHSAKQVLRELGKIKNSLASE